MVKKANSRYDWQAFDGKSMNSFPFINPRELWSDDDLFIKLQYGQRIDNIAHQYLGSGSYWWILCLVNGLKTPFDQTLVEGKLLRIPISIAKIFKILEEKKK